MASPSARLALGAGPRAAHFAQQVFADLDTLTAGGRMLLVPLALTLSLALAQSAPAELPPAPVAAQPEVPRFTKTLVGTCGCALYAPPGLSFGPPEKSPDGADVWNGEVAVDGWTFGAVVVRFESPMAGSPDELESLLVGYMEFLRGQFSIVANVGVGRGHTQPDHPAARGVIDYWQGADGDTWAVKGWVDPQRLAVLFISGKGEYPIFNAQQMYLDGFRFQE